jgi:hypothetical protein
VPDAAVVPEKSSEFDGTEDGFEELDRFRRILDDEVGGNGVVARCLIHAVDPRE